MNRLISRSLSTTQRYLQGVVKVTTKEAAAGAAGPSKVSVVDQAVISYKQKQGFFIIPLSKKCFIP